MVTVTRAEVERELKFDGDSVEVETLQGEPLPERSFTSTYYDTGDASLQRAGITLRRRMENGRNVWQLKLPRPEGRLELEEAGGPAELPEALAGLLRARLRGRSLEPVATLRTRRTGRAVQGTEVTLDEVEVLEGAHAVARFSEVEAELTDDTGDLEVVERRLRRAGAHATDGRSKLQRALEATEGKPRPRRLPKSNAPALELFRSYVDTNLDQLTAHDPGVRVGGDPEDVHDMRVAIRRLRAALKAAKPMLDPAWAESLRAELSWLADALGPVRDLDVLGEALSEEIGRLDGGDAITGARLLEPLDPRRRQDGDALLAALDSDRYLALLDRVAAATNAPPIRRADVSLRKRARREFRKLERVVESLGEMPSDAALHKARIRGKRSRYAAELAAGRNTKQIAGYVAALKKLQDTLGEHQDAVVAERELRDLARIGHSPETALVAGRLIERQHERAAAARAELPKRWKRVRRARL